jgi:hypothetical protein
VGDRLSTCVVGMEARRKSRIDPAQENVAFSPFMRSVGLALAPATQVAGSAPSPPRNNSKTDAQSPCKWHNWGARGPVLQKWSRRTQAETQSPPTDSVFGSPGCCGDHLQMLKSRGIAP